MDEKTAGLKGRLQEQFMSRCKQDFMGSVLFTLTFFSKEELIELIDLTILQNSKDDA